MWFGVGSYKKLFTGWMGLKYNGLSVFQKRGLVDKKVGGEEIVGNCNLQRNYLFVSILKIFLTADWRGSGQQFLTLDISTFSSTQSANAVFQKSDKQDCFMYILNRSVNMYESSCSWFFRTTTVIQSGQDLGLKEKCYAVSD